MKSNLRRLCYSQVTQGFFVFFKKIGHLVAPGLSLGQLLESNRNRSMLMTDEQIFSIGIFLF